LIPPRIFPPACAPSIGTDWKAISVFDAEYFDWRDVDGAKIAFHALYTLNGIKIAD